MPQYRVTATQLFIGYIEAESPEAAIEQARIQGLDDCDNELSDYQAELDEATDGEDEDDES